MTPLTFWSVAGDVIWRGDGVCAPLATQNIAGILDVFYDEMMAACAAGKAEPAMTYGELFMQLSKAREAREAWLRATQAPPIHPYQTAGEVVSRIVTALDPTPKGPQP